MEKREEGLGQDAAAQGAGRAVAGNRHRYGDRRAGQVAVLLVSGLAVTAGVGWMHSVARPQFPRWSSQRLSGSALESRLQKAQDQVRKDPDDLRARVDLGLLYYHRGGPFTVDAINELETARDLGALDPDVPYYLGLLYQSEGLYPFAQREFERYLRAHPDHRETELLLAKVLYQTGGYTQSSIRYASLHKRFPKDPVILENMGLSLMAARDMKRAREAFTALKGMGGDAGRRAHYFLGNVHLGERDYRQALKSYAQALPTDSDPPAGLSAIQVYAGIALAAEGLGRRDMALKSWEKVLFKDPENLQARVRLLNLRNPRQIKKVIAITPKARKERKGSS